VIGWIGLRGGRAAPVNPVPTQGEGGTRPDLPAYPSSGITLDCDCGRPGDVVCDGATLCVGCYLDRITPFRRHRRRI
jgi:hypothetical protein